MSRIAEKLKIKIRLQAKNHCGYCLLPQSLNPNLLEIEHLLPTAEGGTDDEICGWRVVYATVIKVCKLKQLIRKQVKAF